MVLLRQGDGGPHQRIGVPHDGRDSRPRRPPLGDPGCEVPALAGRGGGGRSGLHHNDVCRGARGFPGERGAFWEDLHRRPRLPSVRDMAAEVLRAGRGAPDQGLQAGAAVRWHLHGRIRAARAFARLHRRYGPNSRGADDDMVPEGEARAYGACCGELPHRRQVLP